MYLGYWEGRLYWGGEIGILPDTCCSGDWPARDFSYQGGQEEELICIVTIARAGPVLLLGSHAYTHCCMNDKQNAKHEAFLKHSNEGSSIFDLWYSVELGPYQGHKISLFP